MKLQAFGRFCGRFTLALALFAAMARGQAEAKAGLDSQWNAVRALPAGELVQARLLKKGTLRGSIVSSTDVTLTIASKSGQTTVAKSDIKEVKVKGGQLNKNIVGTSIGAAAGVSTAAILDGALTDGNGVSGDAVVLLGALGAGIGLAVTSLRPAYRTVYKVH